MIFKLIGDQGHFVSPKKSVGDNCQLLDFGNHFSDSVTRRLIGYNLGQSQVNIIVNINFRADDRGRGSWQINNPENKLLYRVIINNRQLNGGEPCTITAAPYSRSRVWPSLAARLKPAASRPTQPVAVCWPWPRWHHWHTAKLGQTVCIAVTTGFVFYVYVILVVNFKLCRFLPAGIYCATLLVDCMMDN